MSSPLSLPFARGEEGRGGQQINLMLVYLVEASLQHSPQILTATIILSSAYIKLIIVLHNAKQVYIPYSLTSEPLVVNAITQCNSIFPPSPPLPHLQGAEFTVVVLDDLGRQVLEHVFLHPSQQEGEDLPVERLHRQCPWGGEGRGGEKGREF